jgi:histone H3/H4
MKLEKTKAYKENLQDDRILPILNIKRIYKKITIQKKSKKKNPQKTLI